MEGNTESRKVPETLAEIDQERDRITKQFFDDTNGICRRYLKCQGESVIPQIKTASPEIANLEHMTDPQNWRNKAPSLLDVEMVQAFIEDKRLDQLNATNVAKVFSSTLRYNMDKFADGLLNLAKETYKIREKLFKCSDELLTRAINLEKEKNARIDEQRRKAYETKRQHEFDCSYGVVPYVEYETLPDCEYIQTPDGKAKGVVFTPAEQQRQGTILQTPLRQQGQMKCPYAPLRQNRPVSYRNTK